MTRQSTPTPPFVRKDRFLSLTTAAAIATCGVIAQSHAADPRDLPPAPQRGLASDWLLDSSAFKAGVFRTDHPHELVLENGLVRRTFRLSPNAATVGLDHQVTGHAVIRAVRPEAEVTLDGTTYPVGGLVGQPNHAFLLPEWLETMQTDPAAFQFTGFEVGETRERFAWKRVRHHAPDATWPPKGVHLQMHYRMPGRQDRQSATQPVHLTVHYELYDGVPVLCKWLTLHNGGDTTITVDRFSSEILAVAEEDSPVETRSGVAQPLPQALHVETDFAFGGFNHAHANRHVVHWRPDPQYTSIVNYTRDQPTLLVVSPDRGPAQDIAPGGTFESHRTFQLVHDSTCRTRRGLALKRMYRTIAPWTTENPLMHHLLESRPEAVRQAIDHAAEVGFEMIILSFGSGFNIENDDPAFLDTWKGVADHARSKGIDLGSYSLLSSRPVGGGNDVVSPPGEKPTHGTCPALTSEWGREYFRKLYRFHRHTGFSVFEHDGSYPGDVDVTPRPPLQKGAEDSQWVQWRIIRDFYQWCRAEGIYLNVPDYYFLGGSNKTGMGYREVNWSLPRAHQVIHTRQNIFDGSWEKTPSMGWMFVPLAQYHGGGAAATIEPLDRHRDHYGRMIASNLAMGVQACYRGPRLFDTPATKAVVKQWVDWFKQHRDILESDMVHGRRADGRDLDWMLHVNPKLETKGMLVVFNPLDREISRMLELDLYYTGLEGRARVAPMGGAEAEHPLHRGTRLQLPVTVPAGGLFWATIRNPDAAGDVPDKAGD